MRTAIPPSGRRAIDTSSMKLRMKKMPRPLDFSMFSGVERVGDRLRVEALAFVEHFDDEFLGASRGAELKLDGDVLGAVLAGCRA